MHVVITNTTICIALNTKYAILVYRYLEYTVPILKELDILHRAVELCHGVFLTSLWQEAWIQVSSEICSLMNISVWLYVDIYLTEGTMMSKCMGLILQ